MKKYFKRGILGFCLGITVSVLISLLGSLVLGDGTFHYVSNKLLSYTNNELIAASIQVVLFGIVGLIISMSKLYFEVEEWSLGQQVIIHLIIMTVLMVTIFLITSLSILDYSIILIFLYFMIWNIQYLIYKYKVKRINKVLKEISGETTDIRKSYCIKINKSLLILLTTYLIMIAMFVIYDFLEINLSINLKYIVLIITSIVMIIESINIIKSNNEGSSISKAICPVVSMILLLLVLVINYNGFIETVKEYNINSTNLSEVYIDGLIVGDSIEKFDINKYKATDMYKDDNYNFISEEIRIFEKNNRINKIYGEANKIDISIDGEKNIKNLDDVVSRLGNDYVKSDADNEQLLKKYTYIDKSNKIKLSFIYRDQSINGSKNTIEYAVMSKIG
ncbi:hypothetical protein C671_2727 [[Clostridium] bifermentans ATCC 19299]|uniref:DUF3021 domain-containing protein n=1 Tax=Paraclostridium bifermentans TaxID=1490 RepID=UPI00038CF1C5|nr:DUF3021 domain-containing protein [Paraclostridium bifermentans]EQK41519.1 hypothetical protein C671_2727 [[Clostridium] bifermentans ATCC 19299] [Paraclostridium bifermentans ATCC 19299]NYA10826.1 DUF3021 domain-containing protein [Klebsiella pneumoniae]